MTKFKTALVTGANRGIGLETVRQLAIKGIHVFATVRSLSSAEQLHKLIEQGLSVTVVQLDVCSQESVDTLAARLLSEHVKIDILINNAGVALDQWVPALELDIDLWRQTMEVNLYGALRLCQAFIPAMIADGSGRIVNVSSELGSLQDVQLGSTLAYRSSKTALNSLTALLACELKVYPDILVNASCPGWVKTALGGDDAPLSVAEGADTTVWLATLASGQSGGLYRERKIWPW
ncbi:Putative ketoacyl reductase [Zhongshania aliphaticivorans]|uniref:Ketoacyl reductase n=1 Tax=Zhongshania aliphaticivorans TaxID=1470434 RepID=A0A5S9N5E3_9GAMM|nr:SDR family oxidoreductase [Zhongshania aliphaticivorans]CAA0081311.1 Putative ketoacyl reductase [Zhongshania aliphaticivorans]CAA0084985.1 Putative ketoacyl reductase [Zhongshania aliphaticivorans]